MNKQHLGSAPTHPSSSLRIKPPQYWVNPMFVPRVLWQYLMQRKLFAGA